MKLGKCEGEHKNLNEWVECSEFECQEDQSGENKQTLVIVSGRQEFGIVKV